MWDSVKMRRVNILLLVISGVIAVLVLRLAYMQLWQGAQYKKIAEENRIRQVIAQAPRGTIYDCRGAVLVSNRPSFSISVIPFEYTNAKYANKILADITGMELKQIEGMLEAGKDYPYTPIRIKHNVDAAAITKVKERKNYLPGVIIEAVPIRHYVYNQLAAHVLGYVGRINEEEYKQRRQQGYSPNDLIGKDGIERVWEEALKGEDGGLQVEVNAAGEEVQIIGEKPAVPGKGVVLTLDANLQKAAEEALKQQIDISKKAGQPAKGGSIVVLNVKNGAVLALASSPAFDPNVFAGGISGREWNKLINDPLNPLANKAIQYVYPPGSVFKIVTAAAALDLRLTTPQELFEDRGVYDLYGWKFYGWETKGLGTLNIVDALAWSSDPVFYELGRRMGADNLAGYALTFGLGKPTNIKLLGEETGVVPTEQWKFDTYGQQWYPGETLIAAIGQGYYLVTPLQQAMLLMAVANNGIMYRPMLVDKILSVDGNVIQKFEPEILHTVYLDPEIWTTIRQGLAAVTERGTAQAVFKGLTPPAAGKTGSAETGRGTVHSWFACYAPQDNPEIAVAVLVEDGGEGSFAAAPVARKILEEYYRLYR